MEKELIDSKPSKRMRFKTIDYYRNFRQRIWTKVKQNLQ